MEPRRVRFGGPVGQPRFRSLAAPISTGYTMQSPTAVSPYQADPPGPVLGTGGLNGHLSVTSANKDLLDMSRQLEREAAIEQIKDIAEQSAEMERAARREQTAITAPTSRAGYLVALIVGLLLFWFISVYVFAGNRLLTGGLIAFSALFFLMVLKNTLEKKGARYVAGTVGVAAGVV